MSFTLLLAPPPPDAPTPATLRGSELFESVGCAACHTPSLEGPRGKIPLDSDLLLHDLGPELADGIEMWFASGSEFRTQPLWGIAASAPYLNDGRAEYARRGDRLAWRRGCRRAIAFRCAPGGRAAGSNRLPGLLGGADARSAVCSALASIPEIGAPGGPLRALDAMETARWLEGRRLFDRDTALSEGLGSPFFNGDSCRSCHSQPVIGCWAPGRIGGAGGEMDRQHLLFADHGQQHPAPCLHPLGAPLRLPTTRLSDGNHPRCSGSGWWSRSPRRRSSRTRIRTTPIGDGIRAGRRASSTGGSAASAGRRISPRWGRIRA